MRNLESCLTLSDVSMRGAIRSKLLSNCMWATCWSIENYGQYQRLAMNDRHPQCQVLLQKLLKKEQESGWNSPALDVTTWQHWNTFRWSRLIDGPAGRMIRTRVHVLSASGWCVPSENWPYKLSRDWCETDFVEQFHLASPEVQVTWHLF